MTTEAAPARAAIKLRPYQEEAITAVREGWRRGVRRPMIGLPTGTGKTIIFANVASDAARKERRVLVLAHRDELLQQAADKLLQVDPALAMSIGRVGGILDDFQQPVTVGSVQTLCRSRRMRRVLAASATPMQQETLDAAWAAEDAAAEHRAAAKAARAAYKATREAAHAEAVAEHSEAAARLDAIAEQHRANARVRPFDVVIVDEAHHAAADSYLYLLRQLGCLDVDGPLTIGVSATPTREDHRSLGDVFQSVVYHRDILSMIVAGYLCDLRGVQVKLKEFHADKLKVRAGDFVDSEAGEMLHDAKAPEHTVSAWMSKARGRKTIVFTPTIALAEEMAEEFNKHGIRAENVSGFSTIEQRREALTRFHTGETMVVTNAQVLTEGYDEPSVNCIVIARPTRSQTMYAQMVGRGTRKAPGKTDCLVLDVAGATERNDLTVLPKMFGLGNEPETDGLNLGDLDDIEDALENMGAAELASLRLQEAARQGRIVSKQIELFKKQTTNWVKIDGGWTLQGGGLTLIMESEDGDNWQVRAYPRTGLATVVAENVEQGYAMGLAEDYLKEHGAYAEHLVSKSAAWRGHEPSEKQLRAARRLKVRVPDGATKGEVTDLISAAIAEQRRAQ